jgi:flagellar biosynthesis protein FliQ
VGVFPGLEVDGLDVFGEGLALVVVVVVVVVVALCQACEQVVEVDLW